MASPTGDMAKGFVDASRHRERGSWENTTYPDAPGSNNANEEGDDASVLKSLVSSRSMNVVDNTHDRRPPIRPFRWKAPRLNTEKTSLIDYHIESQSAESTSESLLDMFMDAGSDIRNTFPPISEFSTDSPKYGLPMSNDRFANTPKSRVPRKALHSVIPSLSRKNEVSIRQLNPDVLQNDNFKSGTTDYIMAGSVDNIRTEASPDTGSDECVVSSLFAFKLGKEPLPNTGKTIALANKKKVWSPGMIEVLWKFANEQTPYHLKCWILPGCSKELILGSQFLKMTGSLTNFFHRAKKVLVRSRPQLRLMGKKKERLLGYFNGHLSAALADTGSDLMLVSLEYAQLQDLVIDTAQRSRNVVELPDGTPTWTYGIVRNAKWTIGDDSVHCDFHVLENLTVDIVLSKHYLFELNVFSEHTDSFFDVDAVEGDSQLCGIRLIGNGVGDSGDLESRFLRDVTSQEAFDGQAVKRERLRRMLAAKKIDTLPLAERHEALRHEEEKKQRWNAARAQHKILWNRRGDSGR